MKFLLINGEYFTEKKRDFPTPEEFASSRLLVVCTKNDDNIVGACGIRSLLNILVLYVKKDHRGRGVGTELLRKTIQEAEKRRLGFITLSLSSNNIVAFRLYCRFGFKEVMFLRKSDLILMMLPLTSVGKLAYAFFHMVRFLLPNTFLTYVHTWLYKGTV